ncbi:unnamed protein product [Rotaria socialis]|uniref:Uncharacterized protein n=1 Tax=Rotaria socialis TaxID=392032 RepID=A0A821ZYJ6_9BILA|nr:unnamed protein product [Rotaria socialis]CAF4989520.1 unnamed protein product [Rotaria socialis]
MNPIFVVQVDGFISQSNNPNVNQIIYVEETLMIGTNGGLALFMSSTLIVGIVMVRCLTDYVNLYSSNQLYV